MVSHWTSVYLSAHHIYIHLSFRLSLFCFRMMTWVNISGFSPNLVCALIVWRSGLGLVMGKFWWNTLSARDKPMLSFPDDNLSKCLGILTKLGTCIDIKEIWFGIANGQKLSACNTTMVGYYCFMFLLMLKNNLSYHLVEIYCLQFFACLSACEILINVLFQVLKVLVIIPKTWWIFILHLESKRRTNRGHVWCYSLSFCWKGCK